MTLSWSKRRYVWDEKRGQPKWESEINPVPWLLLGMGVVGVFGMLYYLKRVLGPLR